MVSAVHIDISTHTHTMDRETGVVLNLVFGGVFFSLLNCGAQEIVRNE